MTRAGYCAECQSTVWLADDGSCKNGHSADSVSGHYDVQVTASAPAAPRKVWPFVVAGVVLLVLLVSACACVFVVLSAAPGQEEASAQAAVYEAELADRLEQDYPDWEVVTFDREVVVTSDGPEMTCTYFLKPPGRDFPVGVYFDAAGTGPVVLHDEVLRPEGRFHSRSESLLDYLESAYVKQDRRILAVTSDRTRDVSVSWAEYSGSETVSFEYSETDLLVFDEDAGTWSRE